MILNNDDEMNHIDSFLFVCTMRLNVTNVFKHIAKLCNKNTGIITAILKHKKIQVKSKQYAIVYTTMNIYLEYHCTFSITFLQAGLF